MAGYPLNIKYKKVKPAVRPLLLLKGVAEITIDEMAKHLGVSKSTVSRALSGKGRIGEATRIKIQTFAKEQRMVEKIQETKITATQNIGW